jgi:hypothetical protein
MGLNDIVEFVMALEEAFGIEIEDSDAENMQTVGDLHRAVVRSTADSPTEIWSAIVSIFEMNGVPKEKIRPETRLCDLFGD